MEQVDYKHLTKEESEFQKLLNQWKHEYHIQIKGYQTHIIDGVTIVTGLIFRVKK